MDLLLALLLPIAVLLLGLALLMPKWSRGLAITATVVAGVVILWILINGVEVGSN